MSRRQKSSRLSYQVRLVLASITGIGAGVLPFTVHASAPECSALFSPAKTLQPTLSMSGVGRAHFTPILKAKPELVSVHWPELDRILWASRIGVEEQQAKSFEGTAKIPAKTINDVLGSNFGDAQLKNSFRLVAKSLFQIFENNYGPLPLKVMSLKVNWKEMQESLLAAGESAKGNLQQYFKLSDFVFGFNDAHISVNLPSELTFRLPVQLRSSVGRVFVGTLTSEFPDGQRRPQIGDEVVAINGKTPQEFQKSFAVWNAVSNEETSQAYFAMSFANWRESRGIPLSILGSIGKDNPALSYLNDQGVALRLKSDTGETYEINLPFIKEGLGLIGRGINEEDPRPMIVAGKIPPPKDDDASKSEAFRALAPHTADIFDRFHELFRAEIPVEKKVTDELMALGQRQPSFKLPKNFQEIKVPEFLKTNELTKKLIDDDVLLAGTFEHNGKQVGFLRIASYAPKNIVAAIPALRFMIAQLQAKSDYLELDQTNNPGGYVMFSDIVIKSLVGHYDESKHLRFAVKPTVKFVREFAQMRDMVAQNADKLFTDEEVKEFTKKLDADYRIVYEAYEAKRALSEPVSMVMMSEYFERTLNKALADRTEPVTQAGLTVKISKGQILSTLLKTDIMKTQVYTKPVYMVINELCFSGGDATPASLQDYGRVTLIGNRTAGAGGTVEEFELRGLFDMTIHMTTSLMVRYNGNLVENYGIIPNIFVRTLPTDIRSGGAITLARYQYAIDQDMKAKAEKTVDAATVVGQKAP